MKSRFGEFNPENNEHLAHINAQIQLFQQAKNEVKSFDTWTTATMIATSGLLYLGGFSPLSLLVLCGGSGYVTHRVMQQRPQYDDRYRDQLDKLLEIYLWCANSAGSRVTNSEEFIHVLESIHDVVPLDYLLLWDPQQCTDKFSEQFIEILSRPPHSIPSDLLRKEDEKMEAEAGNATLLGYVGSFFHSKKDGKNELDPDAAVNKWLQLYESSCRTVANFLYGYKPSEKCDLLYMSSTPQLDDLDYRPSISRAAYLLTKDHLYYVDAWNKSCVQVDNESMNLGWLVKELKLQDPVAKRGEKCGCLIENLSSQQLTIISSLTKHEIPVRKAQQFPYSDFFVGIKEKANALKEVATNTFNYAMKLVKT